MSEPLNFQIVDDLNNNYTFYIYHYPNEKIVHFPLRNSEKYFLINLEDLELVQGYKWYINLQDYVFRNYRDKINKKTKLIYLRNEMIKRIYNKESEKGYKLEHINGNK